MSGAGPGSPAGPIQAPSPPRAADHRGQVRVPGGVFEMGDPFGEGHPGDGETPVHEVELPPFFIDATAVTNARFAAFVKDSGYVTEAERLGVSAVFHLSFRGDPADVSHTVSGAPWWLVVRGASWRRPGGPGSDVVTRGNAARGGLRGKRYVWGDDLLKRGRWRRNIWQGDFPFTNTLEDGHLTTAPVRSYTPNGYGLWQMAGNVWEWCSDRFAPGYYARSPRDRPAGPAHGERRVMRGGSYLCHASYCNRYRVAARTGDTPDSFAANVGFRCAGDVAAT